MGRKLDNRWIGISVLAPVMVLALGALRASAEGFSDFIHVQSFKTHGRVSLRIDSSVEVERLKSAQEQSAGFTLLLKGLTLSDLGAPFGSEARWVREVEAVALREQRLAALSLAEREDGVVVSGRWKFAVGDLAPATPRMETFHYRRNDKPLYVVDFWTKPGPTVAQARSAQEHRARKQKLEAARKRMQGRRDRRVANAKLRSELDDNLRFCREPWSESREVFMGYRPLVERFEFSKVLPAKKPDQDFEYHVPEGEAEEFQLFRLAVKLHSTGKHALSVKTLDFLKSRTESEKIRLEADFLRANALLELGYDDPALALLKSVMTRSGTSAAALQAGMFLALKRHDAGDALGALEHFLWLSQYHSRDRRAWVFHLGAAESLATLRQTQRATEEFRKVMQKGPGARQQVLGAIRMGDLFLERRQYDQALAAYFVAAQNFGAEVGQYPSYLLNRAETLYQLGQQDRAREVFSEFMSRHPSSKDGWRATYRMAEMEGRAGRLDAAEKLLQDTVNRYPYSPGSVLSRMRLFSCGTGLEAGVAASAVESYFGKDAASFDPSSDFFSERYVEYREMAHIRALLAAGDEAAAIQRALGDLKSGVLGKTATGQARDAVSRLLGHLFRKTVLKKLGGDPTDESRLAALSYYQEMWPQVSSASPTMIEADYLLSLSRAAVDLGMPEWGKQLAARYEESIQSQRKIASSEVDEIDQRLAHSERAFAEARALWVAGAPEAKIIPLLKQVTEESVQSFEREILWSLIEDRAGRSASAIQRALKAQLLAPESERGQPRLLHWIALLQKKSGNSRMAVQAYRALRATNVPDSEKLAAIGLPPVPSPTFVAMAEADLLSAEGRWGDAAAAIAAIEKTEAQTMGSSVKYEYARILARTGKARDKKKSRQILQALSKEAPEEFWKKLAQEALEPVKTNAKEGNP